MLTKQRFSLRLQKLHAGVNGCHQDIGRAAALVDRQKMPDPLPVRKPSLDVQKRRLRQRRQGLVDAVDHHVGPGAHRVLRKIVRKREMRPVSLIDDQRNLMPVADLCNRPYV